MEETIFDTESLMKRAEDAKKYAVIALIIKAAVFVLSVLLGFLLVFLSVLVCVPALTLFVLVPLIVVFVAVLLLWIPFFVAPVFAVIAIIKSVTLIEDGKKTPEGALPKEINDKVMFALISSIVVVVLLFVKI